MSDDDPDIDRVNTLLAQLKPAPTFGSMLDEIRREIRRAALDLRSGETASALRRLAELDETLSLQDDDQNPAALRSVWTRGPVRPLGSLRLPDGREIAVDEQTALSPPRQLVSGMADHDGPGDARRPQGVLPCPD